MEGNYGNNKTARSNDTCHHSVWNFSTIAPLSMGCVVIVLSMVPLALVLSDFWVQFTGFITFLINPWVPWVQIRRPHLAEQMEPPS